MIVPEGLEDGSSGTERSTRHLAADLMKKELDVFFRLKDPALQLEYEIFNFTNQSQSSLLIITVLTTFLMIPLWILGGVGMLQEPFHHHVYIWAGTLFVLLIVGVLLWVLYFRIESWLKVCDQGHVPAAKQRASVRTWLQVLFIIYTTLVCIRLFVRIQHGGDCHHSVMVSNSWECNPYASINAVPSDSAAMVMVMPLLYTMITRGADFRFAMLLLVLTAGVFIAATLVLHSNLFLTMLCSYLIFGATIIVEAKRQSLSVFFLHQQLERSIQAREKAVDEDIITEMRHMIANIAHDLKTPLASFLGGMEFIAQVIQDVKAPGTVAQRTARLEEGLQSIAACVNNMQNTNSFMLMTINRILDFTKASQGMKLNPKNETVDLLEALSLPMNCMKDIQQRVTISLSRIPLSISNCVITDKQWLQENVLCLLSNAVKYSNDGQVTIKVSKGTSEEHSQIPAIISYRVHTDGKETKTSKRMSIDQSEFLRVEVEDTGIGLSDEVMSTLFTPFKQAQRLAGGTGLGLFSLFKRIEALGGSCGVKRRRDGLEGSLFWFQVPYRPDNRCSTLKRGVSTFQSPSSPDAEATSLDVLVVDDSPAILKMTSLMLKRYKHTVSTAVNGAEAVKRVTEGKEAGVAFDVILMDLQMPVMDGLEATKRLRAWEAANGERYGNPVVIIGVSANSDADTASAACAMGADAFLTKPFSVDSFHQTYQEILAHRLETNPNSTSSMPIVDDCEVIPV